MPSRRAMGGLHLSCASTRRLSAASFSRLARSASHGREDSPRFDVLGELLTLPCSARPWIHWIAPCIFITLSNFGLCASPISVDGDRALTLLADAVYLATYNYLSDVYDKYSSSAQAAQSLLRGVLGAVFPFFGIIMVRFTQL